MSIYLPIVTSFNDKGIARAKREFKSLETRSQKAGFILKKAFLPATAALGAMAATAVKLVKEGEAFNTANDRITNIATSMGLFGDNAEQVSKRLQVLAETTAKQVGMDNLSIKATQAKLLTFAELAKTADVAGGAFDRATQAAIDLAAAGFGEAEQNAVQLGKALQDPVKGITALARSGVTFTAKEKEKIKQLVKANKVLEAQDLILGSIEKQVGGTAAATANGTDKLNESFAQMRQKLGVALLPVFEKFMPYLERFAEWAGNNKGLVLGIAAAMGVLATAIIAVNVAMMLNPAVLIAAALIGLGVALVVAYKKFEGFRNGVDGVVKFLGKAFGGLVEVVKGAINAIIRAYNFVNDLWGGKDFALIGQSTGSSAAHFRMMEDNQRNLGAPMGPYVPGTREAIIMEHRADRRRLGMPATGVVINVNGGDPRQVVDAVRRYTYSNGPAPIAVK